MPDLRRSFKTRSGHGGGRMNVPASRDGRDGVSSNGVVEVLQPEKGRD